MKTTKDQRDFIYKKSLEGRLFTPELVNNLIWDIDELETNLKRTEELLERANEVFTVNTTPFKVDDLKQAWLSDYEALRGKK